MNKNTNNKYRKFSKNNFKENSESKSFTKRKIRSSDDSQSNSYKYKNNKSLQNKNNYELREKNLEDYIWGKHSVLASLESGRPINRIWCTSEIRSSDKFFILLKEIKNKGVLVEEVQWSRISQITRGAVHQGIALQVSYTKTLPLEELISSSKVKVFV